MAYTNRKRGLVFIIFGTIILSTGLAAIFAGFSRDDDGAAYGGILCSFIGILLALVGFACLAWRVVVDANGLTRSNLFGLVTYCDSWDSLKSWTLDKVKKGDFAGTKYVVFEFAGRHWPFRVDESDVLFPGFQQFVEDLRSHIGSKERVTQQQKANNERIDRFK
jgi:hypothetical protein